MLLIATSFLLFELWLLRIFVLSGRIFNPTLSVLCLKVAHNFLELLQRRREQEYVVCKTQVCEAVRLRIT